MPKISKTRLKEMLNATENRREIIEAGLSRREMMRMGLLTASGMLVAKRGLSARALNSAGEPTGQCPSPGPITPFLEPLPTHNNGGMVVKQSLQQEGRTAFNGPAPTVLPNTNNNPAINLPFEGRTRPHQMLQDPRFANDPRYNPLVPFDTSRLFEVHQMPVPAANAVVHPALPVQTKLWGFDGRVPGPTYVARYDQAILVRNFNDLPPNNNGFGLNEVSTHLHNGHTPSESDGFPCDWFRRGQYYDHHYPNILAGFDSTHPPPAFGPGNPPGGDPNESLSTLWYHDHKIEFTAQNVYKGLAGFYLLFNNRDTGNEFTGFRLPSFPQFDIPLILTDKVFDQCGQLFFDLFNDDGILGDRFLVNGKIQPFFEVQPRRYRFRILDGGPSRFYQLFLTNLLSPNTVNKFWQISNDGNLLPRPVEVSSIRLGVAERMDIIIDFRPFAGKTIYLENRLIQQDGRGPMGHDLTAPGAGNRLIQFRVSGTLVNDPSFNPATETPPAPAVVFYSLPNKTAAPRVTRRFRFDRTNGMWAINNQLMPVTCNPPRFVVKRNSVEHWTLQNNSGGWMHPIHIHFEEFQFLIRESEDEDNIVPHSENSRKDVAVLRDNEETKLFFRFRDFRGRYPMHCHNTIHEDHAMMLRFDIEDTGFDSKQEP